MTKLAFCLSFDATRNAGDAWGFNALEVHARRLPLAMPVRQGTTTTLASMPGSSHRTAGTHHCGTPIIERDQAKCMRLGCWCTSSLQPRWTGQRHVGCFVPRGCTSPSRASPPLQCTSATAHKVAALRSSTQPPGPAATSAALSSNVARVALQRHHWCCSRAPKNPHRVATGLDANLQLAGAPNCKAACVGRPCKL